MSLKVSYGGRGGVLQEYGVDGLLLRAIQSLYCQSQSLVHIGGSKPDQFHRFCS